MRASDSRFYGQDRPVRIRGCDAAGCVEAGDYRAPRDRELSSYYFFCLNHVRDYNRNWDYFAGMNGGEIEAYVRDATVWERPTWPLGQWAQREQQLRDGVINEFFADEMPPSQPAPPMPKVERDAMMVLELTPPVTFDAIKAQYRVLVKKHHPDANKGSRESEEKFKNINQAYATLKQMYGEEVA